MNQPTIVLAVTAFERRIVNRLFATLTDTLLT